MQIIQATELHRSYIVSVIKERWKVSEQEANLELIVG